MEFNLLEALNDTLRIGTFGIPYLDKKLSGISMADLILIGARSGAGKSSIANSINRANIQDSVLFSLENFKYDDMLTQAYYFYLRKTGDTTTTLRDFIMGDPYANGKINDALKEEMERYVSSIFRKADIIHRRLNFTIDELIASMSDAVLHRGKKLVIIDHLDYIDKDNANETDVSHISRLMKTIRELQDKKKVAVVAISHLRKPMNMKETPAIPSIDEFYGSSNKVKEATAVVMFAPDDEVNVENAGIDKRSTWCCIRKLRLGGIDNTAAKLLFNTRTGTYEKKYSIFSVNYSGNKNSWLRDEG